MFFHRGRADRLRESIPFRANKHLWEEVAGSIPALAADKGCFGDPATLSSPWIAPTLLSAGRCPTVRRPGDVDRAPRGAAASDLDLGFRLSRGCQCR